MKKLLYVFTLILISVGYSSCVPQQGEPGSSGAGLGNAFPNSTAAPPQPEAQGGTGSNGGGNGLKGRVLESYIERDLVEKNYFKGYLVPLIERLETGYPELAADLVHLVRERDWYFVPAQLSEISQKTLGTYISTEQYAIQDLNKIWFNSILFENMKDDAERAALVLHEMIMGVRLMKYQSRQDLCIAQAARVLIKKTSIQNKSASDAAPSHQATSSEEELEQSPSAVSEVSPTREQMEVAYSIQKSYCRSTYPHIVGLPKAEFSLTDADYDMIRKIVSKLLENTIDYREVRSLIETSQFRKYEN